MSRGKLVVIGAAILVAWAVGPLIFTGRSDAVDEQCFYPEPLASHRVCGSEKALRDYQFREGRFEVWDLRLFQSIGKGASSGDPEVLCIRRGQAQAKASDWLYLEDYIRGCKSWGT